MLTWGLWHGKTHRLELYSAPLPIILLVSLAEKFAYWLSHILQWVRLPAFVRSWKRKWPGYDEAYPFEYCYRTNLAEFYYPVCNAVVAWGYRRLHRCSTSLDLSGAQVRAIVNSIPSVGMECEANGTPTWSWSSSK